jgi:hypothetical protein
VYRTQEFLGPGKEFVVDCVSVNGEHRCVAIWLYDKRPANDAKFVYYGGEARLRLLACSGEAEWVRVCVLCLLWATVKLFESVDGVKEERLTAYIFKVLDALGVRHGPSHAEVIWLDDEDQPCLVEVGARPHGGEGTFTQMATPCVGYNQLSVMLDAALAPEACSSLPSRPKRLRAHAAEVTFVARCV